MFFLAKLIFFAVVPRVATGKKSARHHIASRTSSFNITSMLIPHHAAAMFLLCAVKVPDAVTEMMMAELHHQEACQRINSVLKFYTLWRFRYQVWPRMEEGAQQIFKVTGQFVLLALLPLTPLLHSSQPLSICLRSLAHRFHLPASTSRCPPPFWACPVSLYSTHPGCHRIRAACRTPSTKTSR